MNNVRRRRRPTIAGGRVGVIMLVDFGSLGVGLDWKGWEEDEGTYYNKY